MPKTAPVLVVLLVHLALAGTGCAEGTVLGPDESDPGVGGGGGAGGGSVATTAAGSPSGPSTGEGSGGSGAPTEPAAVAKGDLVISEIMANPQKVGDTFGEWLELFNTSEGAIDLKGLVLRHEAADPKAVHVIGSSVIVAAGGYVVLGKDANMAENGGVLVDYLYPSDIGFTNTGDHVAIELADGTVVDETSWVSAAPLGAARSLDPGYFTAALNDDSSHFCAASTPLPQGDYGTPGAPNDACP